MRNQFVKKMAVRLILPAMLLSLLPVRASAWGEEGHRIVARIAARHLTSKTRAAISQILKADKEDPKGCRLKGSLEERLACVSTWADEVKYTDKYKSTAPFHYVDIPIYLPVAQRHYDEQRDCPKQGCSIRALADYRDTLLTSKNDADRAVALKFIVHLIGDLQQPLHNAEDKDQDFNNPENTSADHTKLKGNGNSDLGGNGKLVIWFNETSTKYGCWNLHAIWDDGIIGRSNPNDKAYAKSLDARFNSHKKAQEIAAIQNGSVADWANEALSLAIANAYVLPPPEATDKVCEVKKGDTRECDPYDAATCKASEVHYRYHLGETYFKSNLPVVESQLAYGGLRLAKYLNSIFDPKGK